MEEKSGDPAPSSSPPEGEARWPPHIAASEIRLCRLAARGDLVSLARLRLRLERFGYPVTDENFGFIVDLLSHAREAKTDETVSFDEALVLRWPREPQVAADLFLSREPWSHSQKRELIAIIRAASGRLAPASLLRNLFWINAADDAEKDRGRLAKARVLEQAWRARQRGV